MSEHPCRWTPAILAAVEPHIAGLGLAVHDPFAGTGERLGALCDRLGLAFTGTEIEAPFIIDRRVRQGDSTSALTYPAHRHCIVTSPVYPNGLADHFRARDGSLRHTYRQALASITGHDRPLAEANMGRHGIRSGHKAEARHFDLADRCVRRWPTDVVVNVSDFPHRWELWPLVDRWRALLARHGYMLTGELEVRTPRQRQGANPHRADHETVLIAHRKAAP